MSSLILDLLLVIALLWSALRSPMTRKGDLFRAGGVIQCFWFTHGAGLGTAPCAGYRFGGSCYRCRSYRGAAAGYRGVFAQEAAGIALMRNLLTSCWLLLYPLRLALVLIGVIQCPPCPRRAFDCPKKI